MVSETRIAKNLNKHTEYFGISRDKNSKSYSASKKRRDRQKEKIKLISKK